MSIILDYSMNHKISGVLFMNLSKIQNLLLDLTVDPKTVEILHKDSLLIENKYGLSEKETEFAKEIDREMLKEFSIDVILKRLRQVEPWVFRTLHYLEITDLEQLDRLLLEFTSENVMHQNEWRAKLEDFFNYVLQKIDDPVLLDIVRFEKWIYLFQNNETENTISQVDHFILSPDVALFLANFPADLLITSTSDNSNVSLFKEYHGQNSYILGKQSEEDVDLFEIDGIYYEVLCTCNHPTPKTELLNRLDTLAKKYEITRNSSEMLQELLDLEILI